MNVLLGIWLSADGWVWTAPDDGAAAALVCAEGESVVSAVSAVELLGTG